MEQEEVLHFETSFPEEIHGYILSFLHLKDVISLQFVSRSWYKNCMYYRRSIELNAFSDVVYDAQLKLVLSRANTTKLQVLDLTGCRRLTNASLPVICANNLRELNLSKCDQFTQWSQLSTLTILDKLVATDCDGLDDQGLLNVVQSVPTIRSLDISGCFKVTHKGLLKLGRLKKMKELRMARCQRTNNLSLRSLSKLPTVLSLTVGWCGRVTFAGLDHFRHMTQLESLTLLECKEFGSTECATLATLTQLTRLVLSDARKIDNTCAVFFGTMSGLRALQISDTDLMTKDGVVALSLLDLLEEFVLSGALITDHDILPIPTCLHRLRSLSFAGSRSLANVSCILACSDSLSSLDLSGCFGLLPPAIAVISQLTNLTDLSLMGCKKAELSSEVGKLAKSLTKLVNLRLASTGLSQAGSWNLTQMTTLRLLDVSWSLIHDDCVIPLVKSLTRLDCLKLFGCRDVSDDLCLRLAREHPTLDIKKST